MRIGTASAGVARSCSRSSRRSRSSRFAATSTRGCASVASAGSTRSCSPRAGSTGSASRSEIGHRFDPDVLLPEAGQGALALQVRAGEEELVAAADDADDAITCRGGAALRRARRRRLPRAGRGAPRRRAPDGVWWRRRTARGSSAAPATTPQPSPPRSIEARADGDETGAQPARSRVTFADTVLLPVGGWGIGTGPAVRVLVTRPRGQADELVRTARGARPRGGALPADRRRAARRRADRRDRLRLGRRHERERRPRAPAPRRRAAPAGRRDRPSDGRSARRRRSRSGRLDAGRAARRAAATGREGAVRGGRGRAPAARRRARRRLRRALPNPRARPRRATATATSSCSPRLPRRARSAALGTGIPAVSIGPETTRAAATPASTCWRKRPHTTSTASSAAVTAAARRARPRPMVVCFLSDFGLQDDFVGTCHGVIARIAPDARVIDVTHGIPPQAVLQGALVLADTLPYMPVGVHLAVVDPGVGGVRRAVALRDNEGRLFVGPDNGLLLPAAERAGIAEVHELANPAYALRVDLAHVPRPRSLRTGRRAPRQRRSARGARAAAGARRARAPRAPGARVRGRRRAGDDALRRQLRQHRAEPDAGTTSSESGSSPGRASSSTSSGSATTPWPRARSPTPGRAR